MEYVWIFTRSGNPTDEVVKNAQDSIRRILPDYDLDGQQMSLPHGKGALSNG